jgi:G3E family GTPase
LQLLKRRIIDALIAHSELPIEYLFVEASGKADPSSIEQILNSVIGKVKGKEYDYQGAVCVVDALNFLEQAEVLLALGRQVAASNLIIINKVDLVDDQILEKVEQHIVNINPSAELLRGSHCKVSTDFLTHKLKRTEFAVYQESCNTPGNRPVAHVINAEGIFDKAVFEDFLQALAPWTLRMKGFFHFKEGWYQVDTVGNQHELKPTDIHRPVSELVVISSKGLPALNEIYSNWDKRFLEKIALL